MRSGHHGLYALALVMVSSVTLTSTVYGACLVKSVKGPDGAIHKAHVVAPNGEVGRYQALGFEPQQCDATLDQLKRAVENICRMAANTPSSVRAQLGRARGISLDALCASGRAGLKEMAADHKP